MATQSTDRPLAPASLPVLAGVVALSLVISYVISERAGHDWVAVFAFVGTLGLASIVLDRHGRAEAERHPHPLYRADNLPTEKSPLKTALRVITCSVVLLYVIATASPGTFGSPMPYFTAAIVLYMVIPQVVARRVISRSGKGTRRAQ